MIERKYNFQSSSEFEDEWKVWEKEPNDDHAWAFIHQARRTGHKVYVKGDSQHLNIGIKLLKSWIA